MSTITGLEYYQYRKDVDAIRTDYLEEQKDVIKTVCWSSLSMLNL